MGVYISGSSFVHWSICSSFLPICQVSYAWILHKIVYLSFILSFILSHLYMIYPSIIHRPTPWVLITGSIRYVTLSSKHTQYSRLKATADIMLHGSASRFFTILFYFIFLLNSFHFRHPLPNNLDLILNCLSPRMYGRFAKSWFIYVFKST